MFAIFKPFLKVIIKSERLRKEQRHQLRVNVEISKYRFCGDRRDLTFTLLFTLISLKVYFYDRFKIESMQYDEECFANRMQSDSKR